MEKISQIPTQSNTPNDDYLWNRGDSIVVDPEVAKEIRWAKRRLAARERFFEDFIEPLIESISENISKCVTVLKKETRKRNESDGRYMDIDGLASYIKRTQGAIRNLVLRGAIPHRKQAGRLVFLKNEIDEWLQTAPGKTVDEIKNDI